MFDFSLILPCYNVSKYLDKCLKSIFSNSKQTPYKMEVILVDDGSKDDFAGTASRFFGTELTSDTTVFTHEGCRVVIIRKENGGLSDARNAGLARAQGKYIIFLDPDDYVRDGYFDCIYKHLKDKDLDFLLMGYVSITEDEEGNQISEKVVMPMRSYRYETNAQIVRDFLPQYLGLSVEAMQKQPKGTLLPRIEHSGVWRSVYKRAFLEQHDIKFAVGLKFNEDRMFNAKCMTKATAVDTLMEAFYCYTIRKTGLFSQRNGADMLKNKQQSVEFRAEIVCELQKAGYSIGVESYAASNVLSVIELMNSMCFSDRKQLWQYIGNPMVADSIRVMPYIGKIKFDAPLFLMKRGMFDVLFALIVFARKVGIKFSV